MYVAAPEGIEPSLPALEAGSAPKREARKIASKLSPYVYASTLKGRGAWPLPPALIGSLPLRRLATLVRGRRQGRRAEQDRPRLVAVAGRPHQRGGRRWRHRPDCWFRSRPNAFRSEEHTSELQSLMR